MRTCEYCKHYREAQMRDRDGQEITLGYCHAIRTFPYRTPDYSGCKRWAADPQKVLFK